MVKTRNGSSHQGGSRSKRQRVEFNYDDEITSDEEDMVFESKDREGDSSDESESETANEKRIRLAKSYLQNLQKDLEDDSDEEEGSYGIEQAVAEDRLRAQGKLLEDVTEDWNQEEMDERLTSTVLLRSKSVLTALKLSRDNRSFVRACKDCSIAMYDIETQERTCTFQGKVSAPKQAKKGKRKREGASYRQQGKKECLALQPSFDGRYVVGGLREGKVLVWDPRQGTKEVSSLRGHKDDVTSITQSGHGDQLVMTGSKDRSVKAWDLRMMAFVETFYGHQSHVNCLDALPDASSPNFISGGQDASMRHWRVKEETHLLFKPPSSLTSIESCAILSSQAYAGGCHDGVICIWHQNARKPKLAFQAHGTPSVAKSGGLGDLRRQSTIITVDESNWVSALACVPSGNLLVSGGGDGVIRLWELSRQESSSSSRLGRSAAFLFNKVEQVGAIPAPGFVTHLQFSYAQNAFEQSRYNEEGEGGGLTDGQFLLSNANKEPKTGRWFVNDEAENEVVLHKLT